MNRPAKPFVVPYVDCCDTRTVDLDAKPGKHIIRCLFCGARFKCTKEGNNTENRIVEELEDEEDATGN